LSNFDLKKNAFWVGLGVVFLAYAVFYVVVIGGIDNEKVKKRVQSKKNQLSTVFSAASGDQFPTDNLVNAHNERKGNLKEQLKKSLKYYLDRDEFLEGWIRSEWKSETSSDQLVSKYSRFLQDEIDRMELAFKGEVSEDLAGQREEKIRSMFVGDSLHFGVKRKVQSDELPFGSREKPVRERLGLQAPKEIKTRADVLLDQKRFWILREILEILNKVRVMNLVRIDWEHAGGASVVDEDLASNPFLGGQGKSTEGSGSESSDAPGLIRVRLEAQVPFYRVNHLVQGVLNADLPVRVEGKDIPLSLSTVIRAVRVIKREEDVEVKGPIRIPAGDVPDGQLAAYKQKKIKEEVTKQIKPVNVVIEFYVLDFVDPEKAGEIIGMKLGQDGGS
jgi:hypothetical protein